MRQQQLCRRWQSGRRRRRTRTRRAGQEDCQTRTSPLGSSTRRASDTGPSFVVTSTTSWVCCLPSNGRAVPEARAGCRWRSSTAAAKKCPARFCKGCWPTSCAPRPWGHRHEEGAFFSPSFADTRQRNTERPVETVAATVQGLISTLAIFNLWHILACTDSPDGNGGGIRQRVAMVVQLGGGRTQPTHPVWLKAQVVGTPVAGGYRNSA